VLSVAQLGTRLHVLLEPSTAQPAERCADRLRAAGVTGQAVVVAASLEDVFVASTGFRRTSHVAAQEG
jgi:ABC-2 type transport system ATP-binding protein